MSIVKGKKIDRMLFDFSGHHSKNKIRKALKSAEVVTVVNEGGAYNFYQYYVKVGIYTIWLWLPADAKGILKDYHEVMYSIKEGTNTISAAFDGKFKSQYWAKLDYVTINHLVDIVKHCQRLNDLKVFL